MGQFYGEISVLFFLSFRLKTAFSLRAFGVFVSTQERERERRMFLFERSRLFLASAFLSRVVVAVLFFRRKKTSRAAF